MTPIAQIKIGLQVKGYRRGGFDTNYTWGVPWTVTRIENRGGGRYAIYGNCSKSAERVIADLNEGDGMIAATPSKTYEGEYVTDQAPGAYANGSKLAKINSEGFDAHGDGDVCTVIGSVLAPNGEIGYFVEWEDMPGLATFITAERVTPVV